jgi:putative ABC transport system permease protein
MLELTMAERGYPRAAALIIESVRAAVSQPVPTVVLALLLAASCAVILATVGQTTAAEADVLARIDQAGTRSIILVDTEGRAGLRPDAVMRLASMSGVEWVIGLGPAVDYHNSELEGGRPAAVRVVYGRLPGEPYLSTSPWESRKGTVLVGPWAQQTLGLATPVGGLTGSNGELAVVGWLRANEPLLFLNSGVIAASDPADTNPTLRSIQILANRPEDVAPVAEAARVLSGAEDPASLGIETSETFAQLRAAVAGELGRYSRNLVVMVLAVAVTLIGLTVYGSVTTRRRDFGRRRALGASRTALVGLVVAQTFGVALVGVLIGALIGSWAAWWWSGSSPDLSFTLAVSCLCVVAAILASLPPAIVAAYRDPVRILRVP